ncbi:DUF917 domain-containing protein [Bacillus sp. PK3_68]|uniref:DUF917 domain-containing protein n=1 Tax=Bacillus sp. PK3_68 TaxID=2027408 RepID=UPI000E747770|nr:DUF917 domain-containing protein [Bacillus sp. PK3_68]RJS59369.1 hypothetical protein CJ483_04210 [Bacillus sp. PK3_68]
MKKLTQQMIEQIAIGAAVLGTGGGGDPHLGKLMAMRAIDKYGPVEIISIDQLKEDDLVVPVSMIGAPSVMVEKIPSEEQVIAALEAIEKHFDQKIRAVMPIEIGGGNSLIPIIAAAKKRVPVVDADAMGRAFPEAQMVTFHLDGLKPDPVTMADERGNVVTFSPMNGKWSEKIARALTIEMGGNASMCDYALYGRDVVKSAIPGTLTLAASIGEILMEKHSGNKTAIDLLIDRLRGYSLITGKITSIERKIEGGFTKGIARVAGINEDHSREVTLHFQNEQLLVTEEGNPLAITPDLISILDQETGYPITTESLKYGARVVVIAYPCHEKWRTEKGIATAGPGYFGYDVAYKPVEELHAREVMK